MQLTSILNLCLLFLFGLFFLINSEQRQIITQLNSSEKAPIVGQVFVTQDQLIIQGLGLDQIKKLTISDQKNVIVPIKITHVDAQQIEGRPTSKIKFQPRERYKMTVKIPKQILNYQFEPKKQEILAAIKPGQPHLEWDHYKWKTEELTK